jgi:hypothetical protein
MPVNYWVRNTGECKKRVTIVVSGDVLARMAGLGWGMSVGIQKGVARYLALTDAAIPVLKANLTGSELALLCELGEHVEPAAEQIGCLLWESQFVDKAIFAKHGVDKELLIAKMRAFSLSEHCALLDRVERYWRARWCDVIVDPTTILG